MMLRSVPNRFWAHDSAMEASFSSMPKSSPGVHYKPGGREGCGVVGPARDRRACVPGPDCPSKDATLQGSLAFWGARRI